jgi:protein-ribulosamine 3-kinase
MIRLDVFSGANLFQPTQIATGSNSYSMMKGEYESSKAINTVVYDFAPRPVGWGTFVSNPDVHFFLQDFHEMDQELPDMEKFTLKLAEMHLKSADMHLQMIEPFETLGKPKFGFHVTTHNGSLPQDNSWTDTWEEFYIQGMKRMLALEEKARGPQPDEMKDLLPPLFEKVIPRLLRPMETQGRNINPCLIHGDMWHGNTSTDIATNEPIVFDACCFWGHNECMRTPLIAFPQFTSV